MDLWRQDTADANPVLHVGHSYGASPYLNVLLVPMLSAAPLYDPTEEQEVLFGGLQKLLGPGYVRYAQRRYTALAIASSKGG